MSLTLLAIGIAGLWLLYFGALAVATRRSAVERLAPEDDAPSLTGAGATRIEGRLQRWLSLAGYRKPGASTVFVLSCVGAAIGGAAVAWALSATVLDAVVRTIADVPGGVGETSAVLLEGAPLLIFVVIALVPFLTVRAARRRRVESIERDLPLALELFATLANAGLGFDAALGRIVASGSQDRPLIQELHGFQRDLLGGVPRLHALRNLARRIDITSMTIFVSATIQAEQVGSSITDTLQHQADDLRSRRREQALLEAQALPVRLVFPLVTCFLPGIFVSTVGPVLFQMVQVANGVLRPVAR